MNTGPTISLNVRGSARFRKSASPARHGDAASAVLPRRATVVPGASNFSPSEAFANVTVEEITEVRTLAKDFLTILRSRITYWA